MRLPRSCHLKDYKLNSTTERSRRTLAILLNNPESRPIGKQQAHVVKAPFSVFKREQFVDLNLNLSLLTGWKTPSRTEDPLLGTCSIPPWLAQEPTLKYGNKHSSLQKYQFLSWVTPNEYVQWQWFRLLLINNQFNTTWSMIQSRLLAYDIFIFFLDSTSILVIFTF